MPCQILIVDANPADVSLVKEAFRQAELTPEFHVVTNGDDALAFLHREGIFTNAPRPDFIILERHLPMMSGMEVLQTIKSDPDFAKIPVVVCSAFQDTTELEEAYSLKANAIANKSAQIEQYFSVIKNLYARWCEEGSADAKSVNAHHERAGCGQKSTA
jgi:two-component system, chemotaxis family, response regulator Rcp1